MVHLIFAIAEWITCQDSKAISIFTIHRHHQNRIAYPSRLEAVTMILKMESILSPLHLLKGDVLPMAVMVKVVKMFSLEITALGERLHITGVWKDSRMIALLFGLRQEQF